MSRCPWCESHPLYIAYHDNEWGVPEYDSQQLFEKLILDGAQAGLSWWTILSKRENYRAAFDQFNPDKIAHYSEEKIQELLSNKSIVRNKLKIHAAVTNARIYLDLNERGIDFSDFLWQYVDGSPIVNHYERMNQVPATSLISDKLSKDLKKEGFKFVGSTIIYAFMQAVGMVNDHLTGCPRHDQIIIKYN